MDRVFASGAGDQGSIPGRVIPKTKKIVLDAALLNTQHYNVCIKGNVEQSRDRSTPHTHLGVVANEKGDFGSPSTTVTNFTLLTEKIPLVESLTLYKSDYTIMTVFYTSPIVMGLRLLVYRKMFF